MCDFYIKVPAAPTGLGPDARYIPTLRANTTLKLGTVSFILTEDVDFAHPSNEVVVARTNDNNGVPTFYAIKASGPIVSGAFRSVEKRVGAFSKFKRIPISDPSLVEVISVRDSAGNRYYEVESLDQNTIYLPVPNQSADAATTAKSILRPFIVPRRYALKRSKSNNGFDLVFGYGSTNSRVSVADPTKVVMKTYGKDYISDTSFAPERLLETDKFGIAPENTALTIVYRVASSGASVAMSAKGKVRSGKFYFKNSEQLSSSKMNIVKASIECTNSEQIVGPADSYGAGEIRQAAQGIFTRQNRAVTMKDYKSLIYSMAGAFGSIYRCSIVQDNDSFKRNMNVYVLSKETNGSLGVTPDVVKNNLKVWINEHKMMNDTVDILDAKVVNLAVDFSLGVEEGVDAQKVYDACRAVIIRSVANIKFEIGQDFPVGKIWKELNRVEGVQDVKSVKIKRPIGANYSDIKFNIDENMSANGQQIICPLNVAFEVKFPSKDIAGVVS
jgi:hypothetical protein